MNKFSYNLVVSLSLLAVMIIAVIISPFDNAVGQADANPHLIKVTAHRGDSTNAPENTLQAIKLAIDAGVDAVEIDVQETADHKLIVMHDDNLRRVIGIDKRVAEMTLYEIKSASPLIPTLAEVLRLVSENDNVMLNIEVKGDEHRHIAELLSAQLLQSNLAGRYYVTSVNYNTLLEMKALLPNIQVGLICLKLPKLYTDVEGIDLISLYYPLVTPKLVEEFHSEGKAVHVWTVNTAEQVEKMQKAGVDNIITDNPQFVLKLLNAS